MTVSASGQQYSELIAFGDSLSDLTQIECYLTLTNNTASPMGTFFLASTHAHLLKAAYFDDVPRAVDDDQHRFQSELGFWKHWQCEKLKSAL